MQDAWRGTDGVRIAHRLCILERGPIRAVDPDSARRARVYDLLLVLGWALVAPPYWAMIDSIAESWAAARTSASRWRASASRSSRSNSLLRKWLAIRSASSRISRSRGDEYGPGIAFDNAFDHLRLHWLQRCDGLASGRWLFGRHQ